MIFHTVYILHFVYPLISPWTLESLPPLSILNNAALNMSALRSYLIIFIALWGLDWRRGSRRTMKRVSRWSRGDMIAAWTQVASRSLRERKK